MNIEERLTLVAGTARNVGKTSFVEAWIKYKVKESASIIAAKFIQIKENGYQHFHHNNIETYIIIKENDSFSLKDTSRYLQAGAQASYLVMCKQEFTDKAYKDLISRLDCNTLCIIESAALNEIVKPKQLVVIDRPGSFIRKPYADIIKQKADVLIEDLFTFEHWEYFD
ncbi:MAG: hypothetical protein JXR60_01340 [Bacteroidales bacterium]|nr:hypothetical protein [Bacteroidales bacterium]